MYTATSVAWDTVITGKSLQLMNKFTKIAHSKEIGQFLQKTASALNKAPELEAVTAGGLKVAVPKGAELCALSEASEAINKTRNCIQETASKIAQSPKLAVANEALLKQFNPLHYDPRIIDPQVLCKAVEKLKDIPGSMGSNGALKQVLENAKIGLNSPLSLKGMAYELEKALQLEAKGEKIVELGKKIIREFDIATKTKLIECKNIDWSRLDVKDISRMKGIFGEQQMIARKYGYTFEIHSKNLISEEMKQWLTKKAIIFIEG